jgi:hypothetical protein
VSGRDFLDVVFVGPLAALPPHLQELAAASLLPFHQSLSGVLVNSGAGLARGHPHFPPSPSVHALDLNVAAETLTSAAHYLSCRFPDCARRQLAGMRVGS